MSTSTLLLFVATFYFATNLYDAFKNLLKYNTKDLYREFAKDYVINQKPIVRFLLFTLFGFFLKKCFYFKYENKETGTLVLIEI